MPSRIGYSHWERKGKSDIAVAAYRGSNVDGWLHVTKPTKVACDCGYLAANLYAKSVFGEDALVNVSVEKQSDGRLAGGQDHPEAESLASPTEEASLMEPPCSLT
eukprot:scaffold164219_cov17-Tisochrysis_lutea.AAC.1